MTFLKSLLAAGALTCVAAAASACDGFVALDRAQTTDLINTLRDAEADPLDQYFAFETLMCSDQPGVRDLSLRTAARSDNATVQGQVLLRALMEMEVIPVRLQEVEGLTKDQYERIKAQPSEMLGVTFRDLSQACMSFHRDNHCPPYSNLHVSGTRTTININWNGYSFKGSFALEGDKLVGDVTFKDATYPAEIPLF